MQNSTSPASDHPHASELKPSQVLITWRSQVLSPWIQCKDLWRISRWLWGVGRWMTFFDARWVWTCLDRCLFRTKGSERKLFEMICRFGGWVVDVYMHNDIWHDILIYFLLDFSLSGSCNVGVAMWYKITHISCKSTYIRIYIYVHTKRVIYIIIYIHICIYIYICICM